MFYYLQQNSLSPHILVICFQLTHFLLDDLKTYDKPPHKYEEKAIKYIVYIIVYRLLSRFLYLNAQRCNLVLFLYRASETPAIQRLSIILGAHNLTANQEVYRVRRTVINIVRHHQYQGATYDIALLKMNQSVRYTIGVRPVCLPNNTSEYSSITGKIVFIVAT